MRPDDTYTSRAAACSALDLYLTEQAQTLLVLLATCSVAKGQTWMNDPRLARQQWPQAPKACLPLPVLF